ncbi:hypothetical protein C2857_004906 [Epichloe festucae Fl1]|uniref:Uncharacterized protein n=1 Tax=Epichloe festucae (strain Fl1) TaxID=877507 RepID=A0A7S9KKQ8_EPIFF|nr:hypothetical protein C2857_004906 [Epichloe festucae Fl1]
MRYAPYICAMSGPNPELRRQVVAIYKGEELSKVWFHSPCFKQSLGYIQRPQHGISNAQVLELLYLGREYPLGYKYFQPRLHRAFMSRAAERDEAKIRAGISQAEFVKKEVEALYYLKRYRTLRKRYDPDA